MIKTVKIKNINIGPGHPVCLIAGPCVIEKGDAACRVASNLKDITRKFKIPFIFKASYDKANRTSIQSYRGPGLDTGLKVLSKIKKDLNVSVLSDVHTVEEIQKAQEVLDVIQIPAFLCRQTDLLTAAGQTGKVVNVKKGQFLAPEDMVHAVKKIESAGNHKILLTERGVSFGYNNLVSDFRSIPIMQRIGYPVVFDATHSVQQPGGLGKTSGGDSEYAPLLARCAIVAGCNAVFMEVHPQPRKALSDGPNMIALSRLEQLLAELKELERVMKKGKKYS